ncbi:hypothetical protein Aasi_0327 [Candidatus Amoebophilus asiaticus 5a2]|uniref:Na+/solute symporter n=1 Tax=Amoebophilus asiaticus (strain 5a2) TaxID=452471 RepID=B3ERA9_AMOA5|nr:sodium:solute symporter family protein [Candidatus Amoebophilus asiaticus]ACE05761.1 hypothetical protein Aasi_0327 [Candidatus Amoebophilus asiaticus 5a2]
MNYFNTDAFIVYTFLVATLLIGCFAGRNIKDIKDYTLANRSYGTGILTITMLATYITGSQVIGYVGYVFERSILPFIATFFCGVVVCFLFIARYITPRIRYFEGCLTLAEVMGKLYGNKVRVWVGILGVCYCLIMVTLQIIWMSYIGELINIPKQLSILSGASFLLLYSARGGIRSVAITDVIQFIAISIIIAITINILIDQLNIKNVNISEVFLHIPENNLKFWQHPGLKDYFISCLQGLFPAFPLSFPFMQRMLMAKNKRQLANSQYLSIFYLGLFYMLLTWIRLMAICLKNLGDANMAQQSSKAFIYLIKSYFPVGLKGIVIIGLLAAVMSTADSFLQSAGVLMGYDVIQLLYKKNQQINILKISQYATFFLGIVALFIAISQQVLPRVQYGNIHWGKGINIVRDFVGVVFTIPLIAGIMGLKTDSNSFFISMLATFVTFLIGKLFLPDLWFMPVVIGVNAATFFGAHYIQNKRFVTVKRDTITLA